jgi:small subunit ribosomal protein S5
MAEDITEKKIEIVEEFVPEIAKPESDERVVSIDRISRTVKGGRRIRFRALIVIGDRAGRVGIGVAKANDVQTAIAKAKRVANKVMISVPIINETIPHEIQYTFGTTKVLLKPAPKGHSIIAGGPVRAVVELAGYKNIVSKSIGSANMINNATATYLALKELAASRYAKVTK